MLRPGFAVFLLWSAVAAADPDPGAKKHAGELAAESAQHYKRGEFEISVALLRQAYALYPEPNLLYNLGRSLEGMGDAKGAIDAYERYLTTAKTIDDRGAIERRVATLKASVAAKEPVKPAEPAEPPPVIVAPPIAPHVAPILPPPDDHGPSALPWVPIVLGVGALGGGGVFGFLASDRHDQATSATVGTDAQRLQDDSHRFAAIANVLFIAGGVTLAGGLIWEIHERRSHHRPRASATAHARIGPGGIALEGTFW